MKIFPHIVVATGGLGAILVGFFYIGLPYLTRQGKQVKVPSLEGLTPQVAAEVLGNLRLRIAHHAMTYDAQAMPGTVLQQQPKAGTQVKPDRRIYITVNALQPPLVVVPNMIESSLRNALLLLQNRALQVGRLSYVSDIATQVVLAQTYQGVPLEAGSKLPKGSSIDLTVGGGLVLKHVAVPNLKYQTLAQAKSKLLNTGLQIGHVMTSATGVVQSQSPSAGTKLPLGGEVDLWLGKDQ